MSQLPANSYSPAAASFPNYSFSTGVELLEECFDNTSREFLEMFLIVYIELYRIQLNTQDVKDVKC